MNNKAPKHALFVCFGGMSNVGTLTGLAGLAAIRRAEPGKVGIFCLGGLPTAAPSVMDKTCAAQRVITVDGCPLNCSRKIVEQVGSTPPEASIWGRIAESRKARRPTMPIQMCKRWPRLFLRQSEATEGMNLANPTREFARFACHG